MIDAKRYTLRLVSFQGDKRQNQFVGSVYCPRGYGKGSCPQLSFYEKGFAILKRPLAKSYITKCAAHGIELALVELVYKREPDQLYGKWELPL